MLEANKAIVRRFLDELWNKHNLDILDELTLYPRNPAARPFFAAFPDIHATIDDQIAEGDKVVSRVTFHATHQGEFAGVAPTHQPVHFTEIFIHRLEGGKLAERWSVYDLASLLHQIGAIPSQWTHQGWVASLAS
jgi:predicted ester cyclase